MNSPIAQTLSQNQTLHSHATEVMAIFVIFLPILAKIWLLWQHPLDLCHQKCLVWIGQPRKPPVISTRILVVFFVEMHLYAFIVILVPKLVAMVTPLCPLCTGVSQINSSIAQTLSLYQNLYQYHAYS